MQGYSFYTLFFQHILLLNNDFISNHLAFTTNSFSFHFFLKNIHKNIWLF